MAPAMLDYEKELESYVGQETVELLLENPKSNFLFYFFNILENKHIFTKNYESHRKQLNEYRKIQEWLN